jgi:hypothetical protein
MDFIPRRRNVAMVMYMKPQASRHATKPLHLVTELTCANAPISLSQNYVPTSNLIQNSFDTHSQGRRLRVEKGLAWEVRASCLREVR